MRSAVLKFIYGLTERFLKGDLCQSPAVRGERRCRMHCGARGSGAAQCKQQQRATAQQLHGGGHRQATRDARSLARESQGRASLLAVGTT
jgi:hypothetical protein